MPSSCMQTDHDVVTVPVTVNYVGHCQAIDKQLPTVLAPQYA